MLSHVEVDDASRLNFHDQQHIDDPKCRCHDDEEVRRENRLGMIANEGHPRLRRDLGGASGPWACNDGPCAAKSEFRSSTRAHSRCVPHPKSGCLKPSRGSTSGHPSELSASRLTETSTSKRIGSPFDANGPMCRASQPSGPSASRKISSIEPE